MKIFKSYICVISIFISLSAYSFAAENTAEISQAATGEGTVNEISLEEYFRIEAEKGGGIDPDTKVAGKVNRITFKGIRSVKVNDFLRVDALVLNDRGQRDIFKYRVRWIDKVGFVAGSYDTWQVMALEGHQQAVLTFRAPLNSIIDYRIEIMPNI